MPSGSPSIETRKKQCTDFMSKYSTDLLPQLMLLEEAQVVAEFYQLHGESLTEQSYEAWEQMGGNVQKVMLNIAETITEILQKNNDSVENEVTQYMIGYFRNKFNIAINAHIDINSIEETHKFLIRWSQEIIPESPLFSMTNKISMN